MFNCRDYMTPDIRNRDDDYSKLQTSGENMIKTAKDTIPASAWRNRLNIQNL
jgi:hypothetical protein